MKRLNHQNNIESLTLIANRLDELCEIVTFVGGCVTGLLITDKAAPDVRHTVDIDCIFNAISKQDYHSLSSKLRKKGFKEMSSGSHPICRWNCDGLLIDIMPTEENILGFSNKWYKEAQENAIRKNLDQSTIINVISAPYFLATKLEAFKDRGNQDFLLSHDLEDIISIIDGRAEIITDISEATKALRYYLSNEFNNLMTNPKFLQALPGHLNYNSESHERKIIVEQRINMIINLGIQSEY